MSGKNKKQGVDPLEEDYGLLGLRHYDHQNPHPGSRTEGSNRPIKVEDWDQECV